MAKVDISVRELVDKTQRGELLLPEMQRKYVWPATRVRDLLDSLYRGYPSGTILVWETDEEVKTKELASKPTFSPTTSNRLLLLDGQQRITSLSAVLTGQPITVRRRKRPIDIMFNLDHPDGPPIEVMEVDENDYLTDGDEVNDTESSQADISEELKKRTFVVGYRALQNNPSWVSVSDIFMKSDRDLLKPMSVNSDDTRWDKYAERLNKVRNIAKYMYVMQILERNMSYEEVTEIFVRVNSLGIKLRGSDLAIAQISSKWKGFMNLLEDFASEFGEDGEYVEDWIAVRALTVFATKQSKFNSIGRLKLEHLQEAWRQAKTGIRYAANFVKNNAGMERLDNLSASMLLIPLAVFAHMKDYHLTADEEELLLRWLYLAHMRGHYGMGSSESILNADLSSLFKNCDLRELLNILETHVKKFEVTPEDLINKNINSPFYSMLYTVFRSQGAKDWFTGLTLSTSHLGENHKIQAHHIFPKTLLAPAGYEQKEINDMANLAFLGGGTNRRISNKPPNIYFEKEVIEKRGIEALTSQLVPEDKALWEIENYRQFLSYRRGEIAKAINEFIDNLSTPKAKAVDTLVEDEITGGESHNLEFKSSMRWNYKTEQVDKTLEKVIARTVAAFANSEGGRLIVGVNDQKEVLGVEKDMETLADGSKDKYELAFTNVITNYLGKEIRPHLVAEFVQLKRKTVMTVDVPKFVTPVYLTDGDKAEFHVRSGNASHELNVREANEYISSHWIK